MLRNKGLSITPDEEAMRARLELIQEQLQRSDQFHGKLSQLWAQLQLIKESGRKYGKIDGVEEWDAVSEENMSGITKVSQRTIFYSKLETHFILLLRFWKSKIMVYNILFKCLKQIPSKLIRLVKPGGVIRSTNFNKITVLYNNKKQKKRYSI